MGDNATVTIGGLTISSDLVKSTKKKDGVFTVELQNGDVFTYQAQKNASITVDPYQNDSLIYRNCQGLNYKANGTTYCHRQIIGGDNNIFDCKNNQNDDWTQLTDSYNTTILCDQTDRVASYFHVGDTRTQINNHYNGSRDEKKYTKFVTKDKFDFTNMIKRENVPSVLLEVYDRIAAQNENTYIDTQDELNAFSEEVKQAYFVKKQVDEKAINKMGYDAASYPNKDYFEDYATGGYYIGKAVLLFMPLFSDVTGAIGAVCGMVASIVPSIYDYVTDSNYTHKVSYSATKVQSNNYKEKQ